MPEFRLSEAKARDRLVRMTAGEPVLSASDYDVLLEMARTAEPDPDAEVGSAETLPGWDLNYGAAVGWQWKASRLASEVDKGAEGASISSSQAFAHALQMKEMYEHLSNSYSELSVSTFRRTDVIG